MAIFSKLYNAFRAQIRADDLSCETELDIRCVHCHRKERLQRFSDLRRADHICMGGQHFQFNIGDRQVSPYTHHAIVKSVEIVSQPDQKKNANSLAMVTLVHFYTTPYNMTIQIQETTELLDLRFHEIYIVRYRHPTHPPVTIIQRAEGLMEQNKHAKYSIMSCNCEHFCNWCCIGAEKSFQVESAQTVIRSILVGSANVAGKVLKVVTKLLMVSVDDLSKIAQACCVAVPWGVLAVLVLLFLAYTIYKHNSLDKDMEKGQICSSCCRRKKQEIWMQFMVYCAMQAGGLGLLSLIIAAAASKGLVVGALIVCSLLTFVCISLVPRIRNLFCSPFRGRLIRVKTLKNVWIGDVISFDNWKISHDGIVTAVRIDPKTRNKKGEITVIHYSVPSIFGQRIVVEESIKLDLGNNLILGHDYQNYKVHKPEIVVERARQRLGEKKFGIFSNRSCHFCHWAKLNEDTNDDDDDLYVGARSIPVLQFVQEWDPKESISYLPVRSIHVDQRRGRKHATKSVGREWARIRDDVQDGQVTQFKYRGLWHKGVSTEVQHDERIPSKLWVTVVHYGKDKLVCEEKFPFDLRYDDLWIYKYHPVYRYRKQDVIRRARARIGEANYSYLRHRSSHLAQEIVVKERDNLVTDIDEIKAGDVAWFYYWSLKHEAIVTRVRKGDSKENKTGKITIVHYALDQLFATRTVKEETLDVNLRRELWYVKGYEGYVTYPEDVVVKRAKSRLGEQRFSVNGNTSFDLVHWAKVVQTPAVISKTCSTDEKGATAGCEDELVLLVPNAGFLHEEFQRFRAVSWSDLIPGIIVEYRYYWIWHQGILSESNERRKQIKVIHYGANHLFAKRTIIEDRLQLDLKHDNIWIYRGHPKRCFKASVVLANARRRLGEQRWGKGNRSWDFCKACVLKVSEI